MRPRTPFQSRLLMTPPDAVPAELAETVAAFCATQPDIRAAYVCLVEDTFEGESPWQKLRWSIELNEPPKESGEREAERRAITAAFHEQHRDLIGEYGIGFLGAAGVAAWREYGQCVFRRDG